MANLGDMVVKIRGDITDFNKSIDAAENRFQNSTRNFQKLGMNLTKFVTLPILAIGAASVKAAADMEMQQAAFETMLGSAEKAKSLLKDLVDLAAKTPLQLTDLTQGTKTLLAFGFAQEEILPNLKMLGDISLGNAQKLQSLSLAFGKIRSNGRLMGEELNMMIDAGFNPLNIIAEQTGKTMVELRKEMERGAISAESIGEAFVVATSEGGQFFNGMERASQTFKGLVSTLVDNVVALGRSIGEILLPTLKGIVTALSSWVQRFTALDEATRLQIIQYGLLAAAIGPVILAILKVIQIVPKLKAAFTLLAANPMIIAMVALAAAIAYVAIQMKKAATEAQNFKDALSGAADLETTKRVLDAKIQEIAYQRTLIQQAENLGNQGKLAAASARMALERLEQELKLINDNYNGKLRNLKSDADRAEQERKLIALEEQKAKAAADAAAARVVNDTAAATAAEAQIVAIDQEIAKEIILTDTFISQWEWEKLLASEKEANDKEELERIEEIKQARIEAYKYMYGQIQSIVDGVFANEIANIEASELSEEDKARKIAQVKVKQAKWDKAQALVDIAMNTATAITKALPNIFLAGAIAALGVAQAAVVAAQPLPAVPFAEGGIVQARPGGIQATVAEAGVAEAIIPLDRFDRMLSDMGATGGSGGMTHLVVNLDSRPLLDKIFDATKNRTVLISAGSVV